MDARKYLAMAVAEVVKMRSYDTIVKDLSDINAFPGDCISINYKVKISGRVTLKANGEYDLVIGPAEDNYDS